MSNQTSRFDVVSLPALVTARAAVKAAYAAYRAVEGDGLMHGFESYETAAARGREGAALRSEWQRLSVAYEVAVEAARLAA